VNSGRGGKGCVVLFAAGNGNESVDNDGYASFSKVIAVAACNDSGKRSFYSDFGAAVWCAFPSNDTVPAKTTGIWTTDRSGNAGYNPGQAARGDLAGNYTNRFGGTSSATPGAAGVAALVLSRNPSLRGVDVRDILKRCCDRIDPAGGAFDANGHSRLYGFGRLNARKAVELAMPAVAGDVQIRTAARDVPVRDLQTATLDLTVADNRPLQGLRVTVDIEHTFIGDLVVAVVPPPAMGVGRTVLHSRTGGGTQNLRQTYDAISTPGLAAFSGRIPQGTWRLEVADQDRRDEGKIRSFTLEFHF
jgi:subtilisin-like proprotein convertase family protein